MTVIAEQTTTTLINVSGNRYRVARAEVSPNKALAAFDRVKSDTAILEAAIANPALVINAALIKRILIFLHAVGTLTIYLAIKVHKLEKSR